MTACAAGQPLQNWSPVPAMRNSSVPPGTKNLQRDPSPRNQPHFPTKSFLFPMTKRSSHPPTNFPPQQLLPVPEPVTKLIHRKRQTGTPQCPPSKIFSPFYPPISVYIQNIQKVALSRATHYKLTVHFSEQAACSHQLLVVLMLSFCSFRMMSPVSGSIIMSKLERMVNLKPATS